jgi:predicted ThiF/HesA family dinucleotide-utilizing enzyme
VENRAGRVGFGFGFGSGRLGQFDFLEEIGSGQGRVGSIYMLCFFRSLIDFDWIKGHLISGRIGPGQFDFLKKLGRVGFGSGLDPDGSDGFLGSGRVLPPHKLNFLILSEISIYCIEL